MEQCAKRAFLRAEKLPLRAEMRLNQGEEKWKEPTNPKSVKEARCTDSAQEWKQPEDAALFREEETAVVTKFPREGRIRKSVAGTDCICWTNCDWRTELKSCFRLKKNFQYAYVYKHCESVADKKLVLLFCKSNKKQSQVGFSVGKKYGHAVARNRLRRQLKAAASKFMPHVKDGFNLVFVPRLAEEYKFDGILSSMEKLLVKADLMKTIAWEGLEKKAKIADKENYGWNMSALRCWSFTKRLFQSWKGKDANSARVVPFTRWKHIANTAFLRGHGSR